MADVKGVFKALFPFLSMGASLGGPLGTMAANAVGKALGVDKVDGTTDGIQAAMLGATPDQMIALKKVETDFQLQMKELGIKSLEEFEALAVGDRANARTMQVQVRSWIVPAIAVVFVLGFFAVTGLKLAHVITAADSTANDLVTTLRDGLIMILAYYYGSSSGSDRKTELMAQAAT